MAAQPSFPFFDKIRPAKPFLKWAGGKARLLPTLRQLIPPTFTRYIEPFVGGGAVLFSIAPTAGVINDLNPDLIECYEVVRDTPSALLDALAMMTVNSTEFYRWRATDPVSLNRVVRAARFIYLDKTYFNGF